MSVQQIIAQLNSSERIKPPSPVPSPTATIIKGCNTEKERSNNNFATLLDKFGQYQQQEQTPTPSSERSRSPQASSVSVSAIPYESILSSNKEPSEQHRQKGRESPRCPKNTNTLSSFDTISDDLLKMIQELVERNEEAEQYIEHLQSKVDEFASDVTKVRDYQIRVEYLASKLEQVSEERDYFEHELLKYQSIETTTGFNEGTGGGAFTMTKEHALDDSSPIADNHYSLNDFLGIYEQLPPDTMSSGEENSSDNENDELQVFESDNDDELSPATPAIEEDKETRTRHQINSQVHQQEEISILNDQLAQCDKGLQMTLMNYVTDLEKQRLETKCLKEVIKKQDELITKLEKKLSTTTCGGGGGGVADDLLKEQVDLQKIELENKRELLSQLLTEREELLQRLNKKDRTGALHQEPPAIMPNQIVRVTTPPLTAPPKQPLPPLPKHCHHSLSS